MKPICAILLLLSIAIDSSSAAICQNLPPGIERVIRGIDITELDLVPTELTLSNGFNHPIIEFTCTTGRKWHNPADPSVIYDVPDQVEAINSLPGGVVDFKSHLYVSHTDVKTTKSGGGGIGFLFGMFSGSHSYKTIQETIIDKLDSVVELSAYVSAYELQLKPYLQQKLGASVQLFVDQLPTSYQQNPDKYQEFISTFGTHFFSSGFYGGFLSTSIEVTESLVQRLKETETKTQAGASFLGLIKLHGGYNGATNRVSDDFKKYSHIHEAYYGGNANLMTGGLPNYNQWWTSVPRNPWLFGGKLVPMTNLIPAGPKRDALAMATTVRLDKAYVEDLSRSLGYLLPLFYMQKREVAKDKTLGTNYLAQLNALKNQAIPNHSQVLSMGPLVDAYITKMRNIGANYCAHDRKYCNSDLDKSYYSTASFYESYTNKTTVLLDPELLDSL